MRPLHFTSLLMLSTALCGCGGCPPGLPGLNGGGDPGAACEPTHNNAPANRAREDGGVAARCERVSELRFSCEESFVQGGALDIVWVIDNSPSMDVEIKGIRDNMNRFAHEISVTGLDFHVVLVSGDENADNGLCIGEPLAGPDCTNSAHFKHVNQEVYSTNGPRLMLDRYNVYADFLRAEAQHHIVFVTDDDSDITATEIQTRIPQEAPLLANPVFHGVVGLNWDDCPDIANVGVEYRELAQRSGGILVPICCQDYGKVVQALAKDVAAGTLRFPLLRPALANSVHVFLETEDEDGGMGRTNATGWAYAEDLQAVVFEESARPQSGTRIIVVYSAAG